MRLHVAHPGGGGLVGGSAGRTAVGAGEPLTRRADIARGGGDSTTEKPTGDHMLEALGAAAQVEPTVSVAAYEAWRAECPEERGTPEWAIKHRFGIWSAALQAAGRTSARRNDERELPGRCCSLGCAPPRRRWKAPSQSRYEQVRTSGVAGPLPSLGTCIKRFGSWSEAKRRAGIR